MSHPTKELADAVVAELNGRSYSLPFTAQRRWAPLLEVSELTALTVTVVPKDLARTPATRKADQLDPSVWIGIQQKLTPGTEAETAAQIDQLVDLVHEIAESLTRTRPATLPDAACVGVENDPVVSPEHLRAERVFTSILTATYRLVR